MSTWHTIDTAPRNGDIVDIWHEKYTRITDVWWDDDEKIWVGIDQGDEGVTHWMKPLRPDGEPMYVMLGGRSIVGQ